MRLKVRLLFLFAALLSQQANAQWEHLVEPLEYTGVNNANGSLSFHLRNKSTTARQILEVRVEYTCGGSSTPSIAAVRMDAIILPGEVFNTPPFDSKCKNTSNFKFKSSAHKLATEIQIAKALKDKGSTETVVATPQAIPDEVLKLNCGSGDLRSFKILTPKGQKQAVLLFNQLPDNQRIVINVNPILKSNVADKAVRIRQSVFRKLCTLEDNTPLGFGQEGILNIQKYLKEQMDKAVKICKSSAHAAACRQSEYFKQFVSPSGVRG
ncbi:MAG: hypothetical protein HOH19_01575 [Kordiimonadaceae bacterium]|mgnify:CR=1 FL=1|jgi:hypothetical protein|nr:hypothetical protein [Kordiimonadaceae bacterium]MBT6031238.1 hypothetical protein [Kordiimonadaceae bacterium]